MTTCHNCGAIINPEFGADSPVDHQDAEGTHDDPRAPGDYDNVCAVCNYALGVRGFPEKACDE